MNVQIPAVILWSHHTIVESEQFVLFTHCLQARYVERGILVPEQFLPLGLTLAFPYLMVDLAEFLLMQLDLVLLPQSLSMLQVKQE